VRLLVSTFAEGQNYLSTDLLASNWNLSFAVHNLIHLFGAMIAPSKIILWHGGEEYLISKGSIEVYFMASSKLV
jgi:hypothetical protein